jgi:hypothetical protein
MSEQERAKIDRFIAWLLEHPDKIPAAEQALETWNNRKPLAQSYTSPAQGVFILPGQNHFFFRFLR